MPKLIAAIDLYEMRKRRLKLGGTKDLMASLESALMADTKRKLTERVEPEKNASHCPLFAFRGLTTKIRDRRAG